MLTDGVVWNSGTRAEIKVSRKRLLSMVTLHDDVREVLRHFGVFLAREKQCVWRAEIALRELANDDVDTRETLTKIGAILGLDSRAKLFSATEFKNAAALMRSAAEHRWKSELLVRIGADICRRSYPDIQATFDDAIRLCSIASEFEEASISEMLYELAIQLPALRNLLVADRATIMARNPEKFLVDSSSTLRKALEGIVVLSKEDAANWLQFPQTAKYALLGQAEDDHKLTDDILASACVSRASEVDELLIAPWRRRKKSLNRRNPMFSATSRIETLAGRLKRRAGGQTEFRDVHGRANIIYQDRVALFKPPEDHFYAGGGFPSVASIFDLARVSFSANLHQVFKPHVCILLGSISATSELSIKQGGNYASVFDYDKLLLPVAVYSVGENMDHVALEADHDPRNIWLVPCKAFTFVSDIWLESFD